MRFRGRLWVSESALSSKLAHASSSSPSSCQPFIKPLASNTCCRALREKAKTRDRKPQGPNGKPRSHCLTPCSVFAAAEDRRAAILGAIPHSIECSESNTLIYSTSCKTGFISFGCWGRVTFSKGISTSSCFHVFLPPRAQTGTLA